MSLPLIYNNFTAESENPGECTFDKGMCGFQDDRNFDDFDWTRKNMGTPSSWTGPKRDHTRGNWTGAWQYGVLCEFIRVPNKTTQPYYQLGIIVKIKSKVLLLVEIPYNFTE